MAFTSHTALTSPQANVTGLAYVRDGGNDYFYYTTEQARSHIRCAQLSGGNLTDVTSRNIQFSTANSAVQYPCRGICSDGTFIYALAGQIGHQAVHKYRISDRTFVVAQSLQYQAAHYARGIETYQATGESTRYIVVLKNNNVVAAYNTSIVAQTARNFGLASNLGVTSQEWQDICWDSSTQRLLLIGEGVDNAQEVDLLRGFTITGGHDDREDAQLGQGLDVGAMTYNPNDDDLILAHESSTTWYKFGDAPRWKFGDTNFNITEGTDYTLDLKPLVDNGSTITAGNTYDTQSGLQNASLSNGVFTWTDPPAPRGGAHTQTIYLTFIAALGTHTTRQRFPFVLNARSTPAVAPTWVSTGIPQQVVYEPYTPPTGEEDPSIPAGFRIELSNYISTGTRPITFAAADHSGNVPGTFQITTRYVDNHPLRDRLVYNSAAIDRSIENAVIRVTATNNVGNASVDIPLEVVNLIYPSWHGSTQFNISDTASHSFNLLDDYLTAEPQASLEFVGTPNAAVNANLHGGVLTLQADSLPEGTTSLSYPITVKATNLLTVARTNGVVNGVTRTFNVLVERQQLPHTPPVWHGNQIPIPINSGASKTINLSQYIQSANPSPTFTISNANDFTDLDGTASITGNILSVTAPPITVDLSRTIEITATNDAGGVTAELTFNVTAVVAPAWSVIPHQMVHSGETWMLDLNNYVTGTPTPSIAFNPIPTGDGSDATLANGVVSWVVPDTITEDMVIPFDFRASNSTGMADVSIGVSVLTDEIPVWTMQEIRLRAVEGTETTFDLSEYITQGRPTPSLFLGSNATDIPAVITFMGTSMRVTPTSNSIKVLPFTFDLIARNSSGNATKQINLDIAPVFEDNDTIILSEADYEEIRKLIDTRLTIQELPDEIIAADTIAGGAISWAIDRMPVYEGNPRTLEELTSKRRAVIYRAAGILASSVRRSQDPRLTVLEVNEVQLQNSLFMEAEASAVLAQQRFDELGLSDIPNEIIFVVVP